MEAKEQIESIVLACQTLIRLGFGSRTPENTVRAIAEAIQKQRKDGVKDGI